MADHFIGSNRGVVAANDDASFVYGTSTGATDVEVRIADAAGWTREELHNALKRIVEFLDMPSNVSGTQFPII